MPHLVRIALAVGSSLLVVGCGADPVGPSPKTLDLPPGVYEFTARGFALSDDPQFPPCTPPFQPPAGTAITVYLNLSKEGDTWVGRSITGGRDSVEVRFKDVGSSTNSYGRAVSGSIRGTAADTATVLTPAHGVSATFGTAGVDPVFEGSTDTPISRLVSGRISGAIQFSDSSGSMSTCTAVRWNLQPR